MDGRFVPLSGVGIAGRVGDLQEQLRRMVADKKAQVGIAVIVDGRDTLTVNNDVRYP